MIFYWLLKEKSPAPSSPRPAIARRNLNFKTHWKWTAAVAHLGHERACILPALSLARVILLNAPRARGPGASPLLPATGATHRGRKLLSKDEARRIAANIAKLPGAVFGTNFELLTFTGTYKESAYDENHPRSGRGGGPKRGYSLNSRKHPRTSPAHRSWPRWGWSRPRSPRPGLLPRPRLLPRPLSRGPPMPNRVHDPRNPGWSRHSRKKDGVPGLKVLQGLPSNPCPGTRYSAPRLASATTHNCGS